MGEIQLIFLKLLGRLTLAILRHPTREGPSLAVWPLNVLQSRDKNERVGRDEKGRSHPILRSKVEGVKVKKRFYQANFNLFIPIYQEYFG